MKNRSLESSETPVLLRGCSVPKGNAVAAACNVGAECLSVGIILTVQILSQ